MYPKELYKLFAKFPLSFSRDLLYLDIRGMKGTLCNTISVIIAYCRKKFHEKKALSHSVFLFGAVLYASSSPGERRYL